MSDTSTELDFQSIVIQTQQAVRAYIACLGIAQHEVDALAQDVYLELFRNRQKIPRDVTPLHWLKGIARNLCLNHLRTSARKGRLHHEALAELLNQTTTTAEILLEETEMRELLRECISILSEQRRDILDLRYRQDLSSSDIALIVDSSPEAIRVALHRIRAVLKDCLINKLPGEA